MSIKESIGSVRRDIAQEIESHQQSIAELERADAVLARIWGPLDEDADDEAPAVPAAPSRDRARGGRPRTANVGGDDRILEVLKSGPMSPAALAEKVGIDRVQIRVQTRRLLADGSIVATGQTTNRLLSLPGTSLAAAVARTAAVASGRGGPASGLAEVEGRDRAVLEQLQSSGRGGRSIRELAAVSGDSEAAIGASVTRLGIKGLAECDEVGRWTVA